MREDYITKFEIDVEAITDEKSIKEAIQTLQKGAAKELKKGYIELPVKASTPYKAKDGSSKKQLEAIENLNKAQSDLVAHWNKQSEKGFRASAGYVKELETKYKKFKDSLGGRNKSIQNEQITNIIGTALQPYYTALTQINAQSVKLKKEVIRLKKENQRYNPDFGKASQKEIGKAIKDEKARQLRAEDRATAGINRLGSTDPREYPISTIDAGKTSESELRKSRYSTHRSPWAEEIARTMKEGYEYAAKHLREFIDKELAERTPRGRRTTTEEYLTDIEGRAIGELKGLLIKQEHGDKTITKDDYIEQLGIIRTINTAQNKDLEATFLGIKDALLKPYSDNPNDLLGGTDLEEGAIKGEGKGHVLATETIKQIYSLMNDLWEATNPLEAMAKRFYQDTMEANKKSAKSSKRSKSKRKSAYDEFTSQAVNSEESKHIKELADNVKISGDKTATAIQATTDAVNKGTKATETETNYDKVENVSERQADIELEAEQKATTKANELEEAAIQRDTDTGFNTDAKANELIDTLKTTFSPVSEATNGKCPCEELLNGIYSELQAINQFSSLCNKSLQTLVKRRGSVKDVPAKDKETKKSKNKLPILASEIRPVPVSGIKDEDNRPNIKFGLNEYEERFKYANAVVKHLMDKLNKEIGSAISDNANELESRAKRGSGVSTSDTVYGGRKPSSIFDVKKIMGNIQIAIQKAFPGEANARRILAMNEDEQKRLREARISKFGLTRSDDPTATGDIAQVQRTKNLFNWGGSKRENPLADLVMTEGVKLDVDSITEALRTSIEKNMFKAQTGGIWRNLLGSMTGYIGMPSLEKSRAQAEGLNQVLANTREAALQILENIKSKELDLRGLEEAGKVSYDTNGKIIDKTDNKAGEKLFADLEESKEALRSIISDILYADKIIDKTGGKVTKVISRLGFVSPELRKNNIIIKNINSGLDKNGKVLKFQTRTAEILNYTFQLMSRSIGQMWKNWLSMLNPINLIKKAFGEFMSYNTKWQRTMNVIKYNIHAILEPFMDRVAQFLVNCIGFVDIISMHIQKAYGHFPISLFDQAAADSQKIKEELEAGANATAGFDELHDIGGDNTGANDLFGDIYKPKLSKEWEDLAHRIGRLFEGIITGDMGFGEVMKEILAILGQTLALIAKTIWNWFKQTAIGRYITEHWKEILVKMLAIFLAWKLLKIAGRLIWDALFGNFTNSAIGKVLSNIGGWIGNGLSAIGGKIAGLFTGSGFLAQLGAGFNSVFKGAGLIGLVKEGALTFGSSLGAIIGGGLIAVIGGLIGDGIHDVARDSMESRNMYDIGLMENGGKESDKKGRGILNTIGTIGGDTIKWGSIGVGIGGALGGPLGMLIGGGIGAAIGALAGTIETVLSPAIDAATISARNMNNELQKISYYEGSVQGAKSVVNDLDEMMNVLNDTLTEQTNKVYALGNELGIPRERMDQLVKSVQDGTFNISMLTGAEVGLTDSLTQLSWAQEKNTETSKKLEEAKRKLQKAELDLAIAQDIQAGNFELAAARIEYAYASEVYTADEATKKMVQIAKEGSAEQASAILKDMSPDLQKKFQSEYSVVDKNLDELTKLYFSYSKDEKKYFLQNLTGEVQTEMEKRVKAIEQAVQKAPWWKRLLDIGNNGKIFGISYIGNIGNVPQAATGTNYVASDGLAYIHKGEAIIPQKYNPALGNNDNSNLENAINELNQQVAQINTQVGQGINVHGQFIQRGSDLVATVEKANNKLSNNILNNKVYAR